jgi:hypothetical protein
VIFSTFPLHSILFKDAIEILHMLYVNCAVAAYAPRRRKSFKGEFGRGEAVWLSLLAH